MLSNANLTQQDEIIEANSDTKYNKYQLEKLESMVNSFTNTPVKGFRKKFASVCELSYPPIDTQYNLCTLTVEQILSEMRKIDVLTNYTMLFKTITNTQNDLKTFAQSEILEGKVFLINTQESYVNNAKYLLQNREKAVQVQALENFKPTMEYVKEVLFPKGTLDNSFPSNLDALEIDIDSYDCELLETMLSLSAPKLIVVEFNPIFPPKLVYMQKFKEGASYSGGLYHGCSLSALSIIAEKYNYRLLYTRIFEAFFVKQEFASVFRGLPSGEREVYNSGQYQRSYLEFLSTHGVFIQHFDSWVPVINNWLDVNFLVSRYPIKDKTSLKLGKLDRAKEIIKKLIDDSSVSQNLHYFLGNIKEATNPMPIKKKFIYAAQGPGEIPSRLLELKTSNSDLIFLSFKQCERKCICAWFHVDNWKKSTV